MYGASRCVDQNSNRPTWVLAEKMHLILTEIGQLVCQVMKILVPNMFLQIICLYCTGVHLSRTSGHPILLFLDV